MRAKIIKIITTNCPVSRLPPDLQDGLDSNGIVTVTIEHEERLPDWDEKTRVDKI
jgi:hypothetical protein